MTKERASQLIRLIAVAIMSVVILETLFSPWPLWAARGFVFLAAASVIWLQRKAKDT